MKLLQPTTIIDDYKLEKGEKVILNLEMSADPNKIEEYGFHSHIHHKQNGKYLQCTPTLKVELRYHRSSGPFHIFLAPHEIKDENEYKGCSGAPILDTEGRLVALASQVGVKTKMIYGFSIKECKLLIDQIIAIETIENTGSNK